MAGKYKAIKLCGSTRLMDALMETQSRLTLKEPIAFYTVEEKLDIFLERGYLTGSV